MYYAGLAQWFTAVIPAISVEDMGRIVAQDLLVQKLAKGSSEQMNWVW
jgi:hypothetical protein